MNVTIAHLRIVARVLAYRARALDDAALPPGLRSLLDQCHDDIAVILAATEPDIVALLDSGEPVLSFEALRGIRRSH